MLLFYVYSSWELYKHFNAYYSAILIKVNLKPLMIFLTGMPSEQKPQEVSWLDSTSFHFLTDALRTQKT